MLVDVKHRLRCEKFCFYCIEDFSGSLEGARWTTFSPQPQRQCKPLVCPSMKFGSSMAALPPLPPGGTVKAVGGGRGWGCEGLGAKEVNSSLGQKFREGLATPTPPTRVGGWGQGEKQVPAVSALSSKSKVGILLPRPPPEAPRARGSPNGGRVCPRTWSTALSALGLPPRTETSTGKKVRPVRNKMNPRFLQKAPPSPVPLVSWESPPPLPFWGPCGGQDCLAAPFWGWQARSRCAGWVAQLWAPAWG